MASVVGNSTPTGISGWCTSAGFFPCSTPRTRTNARHGVFFPRCGAWLGVLVDTDEFLVPGQRRAKRRRVSHPRRRVVGGLAAACSADNHLRHAAARVKKVVKAVSDQMVADFT